MKNSLFIGNGLNRAVISDIAWDDLLTKIAKEYDVAHNKKIAFPLEFECIANQILQKKNFSSDDVYLELKEKIAEKLKEATLPENAPHYAFTQLPVDSIFTSNYDYLLEKSLDPGFDYANCKDSKGGNLYNLGSNRTVAEKTFHHVHGELKQPQAICLGYEHYAGMIQNLRKELKKKIGNMNRPQCIDAALGDNKDSKDSKDTELWAEKLFTDNIDIVGFRLAQCEIDMWWLLTYRASLFYSDENGIKAHINNRITFHDIGIERNKEMEYTLKNMHVEYEFHEINDYKDNDKKVEEEKKRKEYYNAYCKIAKELAGRLKSEN